MAHATGTLIGALLLAVAGCGSDNAGSGTGGTSTPTSGAASEDAVAWADKVVPVGGGRDRNADHASQIDTSNPEAARTV